MFRDKKLETLRTKIWLMEKNVESIQKDVELLKYQLAELESNREENSIGGVEAAIDPSRILSRRGSNSKKLALAKAINKK